MEALMDYLKSRITSETPLSCIIDVFEEMCRIPVEQDWILFESGIYDFTGKPQFYFSLVRQLPHTDEEDDDEYYQIRVDVLYDPSQKNKKFREATWNMDIEGNIFDYVRESEVFDEIKNDKYGSVEIRLDET